MHIIMISCYHSLGEAKSAASQHEGLMLKSSLKLEVMEVDIERFNFILLIGVI